MLQVKELLKENKGRWMGVSLDEAVAWLEEMDAIVARITKTKPKLVEQAEEGGGDYQLEGLLSIAKAVLPVALEMLQVQKCLLHQLAQIRFFLFRGQAVRVLLLEVLLHCRTCN